MVSFFGKKGHACLKRCDIKPFSLDELVERIRAAARSIYGNVNNYLKAGDLVMNLSSQRMNSYKPVGLEKQVYI